MKDLQLVIDEKTCVKCGLCADDCPAAVLSATNGFPSAIAERTDDCIECQHCLAICPTGALSVFGIDPEKSIPLGADVFPSRERMKNLVRGRRSVRQFHWKNVDPRLVAELLADLAHAPTGCNDRALDFLVIDDIGEMRSFRDKVVATVEAGLRDKRQIPEFLASAVEAYRRDGTDDFFRGAPHLLVVSAKPRATCGTQDVILAMAYFDLLAQSAGLGTTWCGMLDFTAASFPEVRGFLEIEAGVPFYGMMFGYPAIKYARTVQRDDAASIRRHQSH